MDARTCTLRGRVFAAAGITAASLLVGGTAGAGAATASTPPVTSIELASSVVHVTSTSGHHVAVKVHAVFSNLQPQDDVADITLTQMDGASGVNGTENQILAFVIGSSDLTATAAGKGTFRMTSTEITPFGFLRLTMTPASKPSVQQCNGSPGISTTPEHLSGAFFFDSHSKWGKVGFRNSAKPFVFPGTSTLRRVYKGAVSCETPTKPACASELIWTSTTTAMGDFHGNYFAIEGLTGYTVNGRSVIDGAKYQSVTSGTNGVLREDEVIAPVPPPSLTTTPDPYEQGYEDASLTMTAQAPTSQGGATISNPGAGSSATYSSQAKPCGTGSNTVNEKTWAGSEYDNDANSLTLSGQILGAIRVPNNVQATLTSITP